MKVRVTVTIFATITGITLALSFRTPPSSQLGIAVVPPPVTSSSATSPAPLSTPSAAPPSGGSSPSPSSTPSSVGFKNGTFTGQNITNYFGPMQVQVVVSGGKITNVKAIASPNDNPQSSYIASVALPELRQEVLQAQSAKINIVSGATYDSQSYTQSVQSALDMARV